MEIGGDRGLVGLVLFRLLFFVVRDFQLRRRGLQRKLELGLGLRTRGDARLFPRRVDRWMLRIEALRSLQRIPRRLRVPEERMCARFPRPRLHGVRLEGEDFVEALQGLAGSIVIQQNFPLREPRSDEIPFERDRAVVILDRGPPSAFPLEELSLAEDDRRVLRILPQGLGEEGLGRVGVAQPQERVAESEDRADVRGADIEDGLEQDDGLIRMPIPPELLRLQSDVARFRRIESQGLAQRVDRVGEPSEAEQEVASLEPRPSVRPVLVEDPPVRLKGFFLPIEQHQDIRSIEPGPGVLRSIS